jgi:pimeloyl-ACP methyl ester carboxylesterase
MPFAGRRRAAAHSRGILAAGYGKERCQRSQVMEGARRKNGANSCSRPDPRSLPALLLCAILLTGCHSYSSRDRQTFSASEIRHTTFMPASGIACPTSASLAQAEGDFETGAQQESNGLESCVDFYYRASILSWQHLESSSASSADPRYQAAWRIYQRSLARLITTGCRFGRLDPRGRLIVADASGRHAVPITYYGFPWKPNEFCQVLRAGEFESRDIVRRYRSDGLGVSLVAMRQACGDDPHYSARQHFPVTAVLRLTGSSCHAADGSVPTDSCASTAVLEFYNPLLFDSLRVGPMVIGMERDLTAPFACLLKDTPRKFTEGFLDPGDADVKPKLFMMEPYQRGKIPVVFIHGLWSDPVTWVDAVNDLRAQGDICRQYQFWFFRYPTGKGLLESAAELREKLLLARESFDPAHQDAAMDRMVLVGHSMGGLVARLQVTYSYDILWRYAAKGPLETVRTTPAMRERLRRAFYFDPSSSVRRVVFIGTPHRGSTTSRRLVGRIASDLVHISGPEETQYQQLMGNNRDIFAEYLWKSWPTSIDLLEPSNPLLQAFACMPYSRCVRLHSIIGTGGRTLGGESGDGLVSVSSARQAGVCSELYVPVRHEKLHRDPASVNDLMRILRQHARESSSMTASGTLQAEVAAKTR